MMKHMKHMTWHVALACFVLAALTACQSPNEPVQPRPSENTTKTTEGTENIPPETESDETEPNDTEPVETKPVETKPVETKPVETKPVETQPSENQPIIGDEITVDPSYEPSYRVLDTGSSSSLGNILQINHTTDIVLDLKETKRIENPQPQPPESYIFQIGDYAYPATYQCTATPILYPSAYHWYKGTDEEGTPYHFEVHVETGNLRMFYHDFSIHQLEEDPAEMAKPCLTEAECIAVAEKFLFEDCGLQGTYRLVKSEYHPEKRYSGCPYYKYTFRRTVDGITAEEYLQVNVTDRGRITYYVPHLFGNMDGVTVPTYDKDEVLKSVEHKLSEIYKNVIAKRDFRYVIDDVRLLRLYDEGELYLVYYIDIFLDGGCYEQAKLLVPLA